MDGYKKTTGADISPSADRIRALELQYIELLEKRIAALEKADTTPQEKKSTTPPMNSAKPGEEPKPGSIADNTVASGDQGSATQPENPAIAFKESYYDDDGFRVERDAKEELSEPAQRSLTAKRSGNSPRITWIRDLDHEQKYSSSTVRVEGPELCALLQLALSHEPSFHFSQDGIQELVEISSPFTALVHNWRKLGALTLNNDGSDTVQSFKGRIAKIDPRTDSEEESQLLSNGAAAAQISDPEKAERAKLDLKVLLERVQGTSELKTYFAGLDTQERSRSIQFDFLWTIFPPGELVYATVFMKRPQLFIVKEHFFDLIDESDSGREEKKCLVLVCWSYDWNGRTFNRVPVQFRFEKFQGLKSITTLPCYPLRFREDASSIRACLLVRGKRFQNLCTRPRGQQMFDYKGVGITTSTGFKRLRGQDSAYLSDPPSPLFYAHRRRVVLPPNARDNRTRRQEINGRVMVDFESYLHHSSTTTRYGPMGDVEYSQYDDECRCSLCSINQDLRDNQRSNFDDFSGSKPFLNEEQFVICPPRVLGYHLDSRTWLELDISERDAPPSDDDDEDSPVEALTPQKYLEDIEEPVSKKAFHALQLAPEQKELIEQLVQSHTSGTGKEPLMEDIMKKKGKGLVILLHGAPGVGKTLTAESVAQMAGKPLFPVSTSDIGLEPAEVEHNLDTLFELAGKWRAVLLFDEADVFLESRSSNTSDLTRNALVSVLLRVLEYYDGILILTTNRIQQFDIAVQSRVNLGIMYNDLTMDQKRQIYHNFIDQLKGQSESGKEKLKNLFKEENFFFNHLNGRQIRNVLFSAASLAQKDSAGKLKKDHIRRMARSTYEFQDSMKSIVQKARDKAEAGRD